MFLDKLSWLLTLKLGEVKVLKVHIKDLGKFFLKENTSWFKVQEYKLNDNNFMLCIIEREATTITTYGGGHW